MSTTPDPANLRELYGRLCTAYHAIDDFRGKLLGFLPVVSAASIWGIFGAGTDLVQNHIPFIGLLGALTVLALAVYEMKGIQKCVAIIGAGAEIEKKLLGSNESMLFGRLNDQPPGWKVVTEPFASALIYGVSFGAWTYVAGQSVLSFFFKNQAEGESPSAGEDVPIWAPVVVAIVAAMLAIALSVIMYRYWLKLVSDNETQAQKSKLPKGLGLRIKVLVVRLLKPSIERFELEVKKAQEDASNS